mmetsp:Transcript_19343/g.77045  ORF Transcript_19343/g.77045 Transcript_19343/m.77045 type:complete len:254 (+) Transcript_19343:300-1061(+)
MVLRRRRGVHSIIRDIIIAAAAGAEEIFRARRHHVIIVIFGERRAGEVVELAVAEGGHLARVLLHRLGAMLGHRRPQRREGRVAEPPHLLALRPRRPLGRLLAPLLAYFAVLGARLVELRRESGDDVVHVRRQHVSQIRRGLVARLPLLVADPPQHRLARRRELRRERRDDLLALGFVEQLVHVALVSRVERLLAALGYGRRRGRDADEKRFARRAELVEIALDARRVAQLVGDGGVGLVVGGSHHRLAVGGA